MRDPKKWMVDPCRDANGGYTIREDDGTEHGDTSKQPIATAYDKEDAYFIASMPSTGLAVMAVIDDCEKKMEAAQ